MISQKQLQQAQEKCEFSVDMVKRLQDHDDKSEGKGQSARHWAVFDGVLHRTTEAADASEGYDSARPFVPESLRPTVLHNFHNSIWGGHKGAEATS